MKHLDLFSGIGGFALACQWAGIETIGFVEIDKYCQKVLRKHWPDVPIVEDIRDVEQIKQIVANTKGFPIEQHGQARESFNDSGRTRLEPIGSNSRPGSVSIAESNHQSPALLITAGFPCQPFSVAGKRGGQADDRYLWPETLAVIKAVNPEWILLENVTGIINLALDQVLSDLEGAGYATETLIIPACAVNAWHRRDRVWIVANNEQPTSWRRRLYGNLRIEGWQIATAESEGIQPTDRQACPDNSESGSQDVANTQRKRQSRGSMPSDRGNESKDKQGRNQSRSEVEQYLRVWAVEPELGRVAHGIPHRVDRLKCLGNAIVPQVAYEIIKVIKEIPLSMELG